MAAKEKRMAKWRRRKASIVSRKKASAKKAYERRRVKKNIGKAKIENRNEKWHHQRNGVSAEETAEKSISENIKSYQRRGISISEIEEKGKPRRREMKRRREKRENNERKAMTKKMKIMKERKVIMKEGEIMKMK